MYMYMYMYVYNGIERSDVPRILSPPERSCNHPDRYRPFIVMLPADGAGGGGKLEQCALAFRTRLEGSRKEGRQRRFEKAGCHLYQGGLGTKGREEGG
jgi:hypothetical protein